MKIHQLKTDPGVFDAVIQGKKTFEIRLNDRDYRVGDVLKLCETVYVGEAMKVGAPLIYTGRDCYVEVTYILYGPIYGLQEKWVIMSITPIPAQFEDNTPLTLTTKD